MYTTIENVKTYTDTDVTQAELLRAQAMIEAYTGRVESEVTNDRDLRLLERATIYQAAYMQAYPTVFAELWTTEFEYNDWRYKFQNETAPFYNAITVMTLRRLSWIGSRSVHVGPVDIIVKRDEWYEQ